MPSTIKIGNLNAYKLHRRLIGTASWKARVTAIKEIGADILGIQEVIVDETDEKGEPRDKAHWTADAAAVIEQLADECGLTAATVTTGGSPGPVAMANNEHRGWYTALLWNPSKAGAVPGGFRAYGAPDFWHGFTTAQFDVGAGEPVTVASYHGDPFRGDWRLAEALRVKGAFRRTGGAKPGFVVGDFNGLSAAKVLGADGRPRYYDGEPYRDQDHDDLEYQVLAGTIGGEQLADRRQSEVLLRRGFMVDTAAHLGVPPEPTVGHWEDGRGDPDPWGPRRIDLILATRPVAPAVISYRTHRSAAAEEAADHLPVVCEFDPTKMES